MDPNANLKEQLQLAVALEALENAELLDRGDLTLALHDANRLAELVLALDEWLNKGGALPSQWERP